ncbi:Cobyrinic acid ac-diamide synthase [Solidesulfovibrio carbinoliphilus subsp. oakridgensis]|uniref:Cobyrinic acid ac-diamide synthase n=1 Tax=Solidesulfovibrio carbinoliphilus subsp. oakridgensis TaxID=694327 RepID=G7QBN5_9BACT|nr:ATP-binding protein [Solidesulfovibrio carbinoliphilus]EHJ48898.1 Cobyrinic acid ac-diamide synthase [Solidesulfovibrio carbinoliphilus subsp. oakridgensis]
MIAAIASGKGGTGKTTVSASLASVWTEACGRPVLAVDLDVEEPNLHLFLRPTIASSRAATLEVPVVDAAVCTRCGACRELCQFGAITVMGDTPLVFVDMCHGCGGCLAVCPAGAITPGARELGRIEEGAAGPIGFLAGRLRVGEAMSPPLIRAVLRRLGELSAGRDIADRPDVLLDAPPGVSCPATAAVATADCIVLVAEPTPFGLHDFRLAVEAFTPLAKPMAVVINRGGEGSGELRAFCAVAGLPVLAEIPDDRLVAETYARGGLLADVGPDYRSLCLTLVSAVAGLAGRSGGSRHA